MGIEICIINPYATVQSNKKLKHCVSSVIDKSSTVYMDDESIIEDYYSNLKGHWCPVDTEWAIDGLSGKLFIVQARPETIHSRKKDNSLVEYIIESTANKNLRLSGIAVGDKIGQGKIQKMYTVTVQEKSWKIIFFQY